MMTIHRSGAGNGASSVPMVALVATVHDPEARLLPALRTCWASVGRLYHRRFVVATASTHPAVLAAIGEHAVCQLEARPGEIGSARRQAVALGHAAGCHALHYCDLDRWLHWRLTYPDELEQVVRLIPHVDYLILGRTARAFATHPRVQVETEAITNAVCSIYFGGPVDVAAGSCGLAGPAIALILAESSEPTNATDAEWPAIVRSRGGIVVYRAVEGLEFETASFYPAEVEQAGGLEHWLAARSRSLAEWEARTRLAYESIRALRRVTGLR